MKPPFQSIVFAPPHAKYAVLLLHGILSAPQYFDFLRCAIPKEFAIYAPLLAGHGGTPEQLASASLALWKKQVRETVSELLSHYEKIILVAHSMGTLFAVEEAFRMPERIGGMVLLNVPLYARLTPAAAWHSLCIALQLPLKSKRARAMRLAYSLVPDARLWKYLFWIPRYLELFAEIRAVRQKIALLPVPCIVFQSEKDELIPPRAIPILQRVPAVKLFVLRDASHFSYSKETIRQIRQAVHSLCQTLPADSNFASFEEILKK